MKKAEEKKSIKFCITVLFVCLLCFSGCGLTTVYYLVAPTVTYNTPSYSTSDYTSKYFDFLTADAKNTSLEDSGDIPKYLGTAVYYKIFNNYSTMLSYNSAISSVNTSSNSTAAATKMIETYTYQQLGTSSGTVTPLIAASSSNQRVYIRLMNYDSSFAAKITIAGTDTYVPRRVGNNQSFDFGRTTANTTLNKVPASGDDDVVYGTASDSGTWYVDMYAVSVGRDDTYTLTYSLVLHLGAVAISANSTAN